MDGETRTVEDITRELDGGLRELYGGRHRGLVLYGSHARREADEGSDVDPLLLLEGQQVGGEIRRSSGLVDSPSGVRTRALPDPGERRGLSVFFGAVPGQRPPRGSFSPVRRMSDGSEILDDLLAKAWRSLEIAESLLEDGHADFAASRAYYGCFYIAEALLLSEGLSYSRHSQVLAQFGRHFAKTGGRSSRRSSRWTRWTSKQGRRRR